jgi:hypothetical protein
MVPHGKAFFELHEALAYASACAAEFVENNPQYSIELSDDGAGVFLPGVETASVFFEVFGMETE